MNIIVQTSEDNERFHRRAGEIVSANFNNYPHPLRQAVRWALGGRFAHSFLTGVALRQGELDEYIEVRKSEIVGGYVVQLGSSMVAFDVSPGVTDVEEIISAMAENIPSPKCVVIGPGQGRIGVILADLAWEEWARTPNGIRMLTPDPSNYCLLDEMEEQTSDPSPPPLSSQELDQRYRDVLAQTNAIFDRPPSREPLDRRSRRSAQLGDLNIGMVGTISGTASSGTVQFSSGGSTFNSTQWTEPPLIRPQAGWVTLDDDNGDNEEDEYTEEDE